MMRAIEGLLIGGKPQLVLNAALCLQALNSTLWPYPAGAGVDVPRLWLVAFGALSVTLIHCQLFVLRRTGKANDSVSVALTGAATLQAFLVFGIARL